MGKNGYKKLLFHSLVFKGLKVVHSNELIGHSNHALLGIDKSKCLRMIPISSFSLSVHMLKLSKSSVIFNTHLFLWKFQTLSLCIKCKPFSSS